MQAPLKNTPYYSPNLPDSSQNKSLEYSQLEIKPENSKHDPLAHYNFSSNCVRPGLDIYTRVGKNR